MLPISKLAEYEKGTFPHAFAPVHNMILLEETMSDSLALAFNPLPPTMSVSFGTKTSTTCSCSGCLARFQQSSDHLEYTVRSYVPALSYVNYVVFNHYWTSIIVD